MAEEATDRSLGQVTAGVILWLCRRRFTIGLAIFFTAWYGFQLFVADMIGIEAAEKWFYFTPSLGTGWIVAPFSHNMMDVGHLTRNVSTLLLAGLFIETYLKGHQYLAVFFGILGFSVLIPVVGLVLFVDGDWLVAGASGGVYGLWVFGAIYRVEVVQTWRTWIDVDDWSDLRYWIECVIVLFGFTLLILVPIFDVYSGGSANTISHISGMVFGGVLGSVLRTK